MRHTVLALLPVALGLSGCGGGDSSSAVELPALAAALPATFSGDCTSLPTVLGTLANTTITSATTVAAGTVANVATAEHCRVVGKMNERVSAVDGNPYYIGFEIRLPKTWNGRFFYQANGGSDGAIGTASGGISGGGALSTALSKGFAVLSSAAGHQSQTTPFFGLDPRRGWTMATTRSGNSRPWPKI